MPLNLLVHPLARGVDIDSPATTKIRQAIIREKRFLRKIYEEWYGDILAALPAGNGPILEVGTGAGFLADYVPNLITSEVFPVPGVTLVLDSRCLPFASGSLQAIVMTEVLHHIPNSDLFLKEAARCVKPGGRVVMIEPWNSAWARWVYTHLHYEPFRADATEWTFPSTGPLSGANVALPWIIFERDKARFATEYRQWHVASIRLMMPFRYLISGGVTYRSLMPTCSFPLWRLLESGLKPVLRHLAMFACIVLDRAPNHHLPACQSQSSAMTFNS
jgi:SAM-dependent methyltransferase